MDKNNPACYECPKHRQGLHHWRRDNATNKAICINCKLELNEQHTEEVFAGD